MLVLNVVMSEIASPPQIENEKTYQETPEAINISSVESVRAAQRKAHWLRTKGMRAGSFDASGSLASQYDEIVGAHLQAHGVTSDDENYSEYREFLRDRSVDRIGNEWEVGVKDADGNTTISKREETARYLRDKYPKHTEQAEEEDVDEEDSEDPTETNKEASEKDVENAKKALEEYRNHYAHLLAEHSKKMGLLDPNKETKQNREDLADLIGAIATDMMDDLEAQGISKEDRDNAIAEFVAQQTDLLIGEMEEQRLAEKRDLKGWRKWIVNKWASWEPAQGETLKERMFSGHNFANNLKKGAVFAVPGVIAGAALAVPLGAVGAGAGATVGAILIARSIARNLGRAKLDSIAQADTIAHAQAEDIRSRTQAEYQGSIGKYAYKNSDGEVDAAYADSSVAHIAHTELLDLIQDRSDHYRKRNRNRFLGGTAISIAAAAGTAGLMDLLSPFTPGLFGIAGEKVGHVASDLRGNHTPETTPSTVPTEDPGPTELRPGGSSTDAGAGDTPPAPDNDKNPEKFRVLGGGERTISSGEGWYQTFNEMGISAKHNAELLKEVGPKLEDKGLAYWDDNANEWRMNMTENGKMPKYAIELIAKTASDNGWHSDYDKFFDAPDAKASAPSVNTNESVSEYAEGRDEASISRGEGGMKFANEMGIHGAHDQLAVWNDVAPKFEDQGLTYQMADGEWRLYMTDNGKMPMDMIQAMAESAHEQGISSNYDSIFESTADKAADVAASTDAPKPAVETVVVKDFSTESGLVAPNFMIGEFGSTPTGATEAYYDVLAGVDPSHKADVLAAAAHELQGIKGSDGVALTYKTADGQWHFREVSELPREAKEVLARVADKNHWSLAS